MLMMVMNNLDPKRFMRHLERNLSVRIGAQRFLKVFGNTCHVKIKLHGIKCQIV